MAKDILDTASDFAYAQLKKAKGKFAKLKPELQTFIRVDSGQAIIDNGGLQYFFESNWEGTPPYSVFVDAYRKIGARKCADMLQRAVNLFGFENPHLDAERRQARMEELWEDPSEEFADYDLRMCGDETVWTKLQRFVEKNAGSFRRRK